MKKIMFNDKYGLTTAVLDGRKTMTRRIIDSKTSSGAYNYVQRVHGTGLDYLDYLLEHSRFKVGEEVAIAQSYSELSWDARFYERLCSMCERLPQYELAGWDNKMFVRAELMPHMIRITGIRVERLRDITEEDCLREGIYKRAPAPGVQALFAYDTTQDQDGHMLATTWYTTARGAFSGLIDKVSGKGTWGDNPYCFCYTFELIR